MFELNYTINMVYEQKTRRLVPAAWSQKDLPHQLKNITFLKIENKEGSVFAERLQETLGMKVTLFLGGRGSVCRTALCVLGGMCAQCSEMSLPCPSCRTVTDQVEGTHTSTYTQREGGREGRRERGESKSERGRDGGVEGGREGQRD